MAGLATSLAQAQEAPQNEAQRLRALLEAHRGDFDYLPPAIRRALEHRDRGCRFPFCGNRFTDAHHAHHSAPRRK
ncbi:MAG TPA: hypothetical protein VMM18_05510 [Gemmatimonadaceae bacterium]|nr:hypothetical protein [Gemmatimonadaceae bacterium]